MFVRLIFISLFALTAAKACADVLVICPASWQASMKRWVAHRENQGHTVSFASPGSDSRATREFILKAHASRPLEHVILIGDAPLEDHPQTDNLPTSTNYVRAIVSPRWGSPRKIATDHPYADLAEDPKPEIAVGRIPANSAQQLRTYCDRVIAYEKQSAMSFADDRLTIVAAPGNFGPFIDRVIESTAVQMFTKLVPPSCALHLTYADWHSPYCPYPAAMTRTVREGLNTPARGWLYLGHGHKHTLDRLQTPLGPATLLDQSQVDSLNGSEFPPFAAIVACYTGSFEGPDDCLAENLVRHPSGPLCVLASSRICMPYGNSSLGLEALAGLFDPKLTTLGEVVKAAKIQALQQGTSGLRGMVETIAAGMSPRESDRQQERLEHVQMYNLLGDPLLRIHRPQPLTFSAHHDAQRQLVTVSGIAPFAGECRLQLLPKRAGMALLESPRTQLILSNETRDAFTLAYDKANNCQLAELIQNVSKGEFSLKLRLPSQPSIRQTKALQVIGHLAGEGALASGHAQLLVSPIESRPSTELSQTISED